MSSIARAVASDSDAIIAEAEGIAVAPAALSTAKQYKKHIQLFIFILESMGIKAPYAFSTAEMQAKKKDTVRAAIKLIYMRCGPDHENLSAQSTGTTTRSAIISFWEAQGHIGDYTEFPDGSFSGNLGRCPSIQKLVKKLEGSQHRMKTHEIRRAYQETHEDVRTLCDTYFDPVVSKALKCDESVNYAFLQSAVINCCQFGAVARADELLNLRIENLVYSGDSLDSSVCGVLPITKNLSAKSTFLTF